MLVRTVRIRRRSCLNPNCVCMSKTESFPPNLRPSCALPCVVLSIRVSSPVWIKGALWLCGPLQCDSPVVRLPCPTAAPGCVIRQRSQSPAAESHVRLLSSSFLFPLHHHLDLTYYDPPRGKIQWPMSWRLRLQNYLRSRWRRAETMRPRG